MAEESIPIAETLDGGFNQNMSKMNIWRKG